MFETRALILISCINRLQTTKTSSSHHCVETEIVCDNSNMIPKTWLNKPFFCCLFIAYEISLAHTKSHHLISGPKFYGISITISGHQPNTIVVINWMPFIVRNGPIKSHHQFYLSFWMGRIHSAPLFFANETTCTDYYHRINFNF